MADTNPTEPQAQTPPQDSPAPAAAAGGEASGLNIDEGLIESNWDTVTDSFDDMKLKPELLRGVYAYGFERPSAIQERAIMPICTGRDVIAQAQSGTGKTATFTISILQRIDMALREPQALILAPPVSSPSRSKRSSSPSETT